MKLNSIKINEQIIALVDAFGDNLYSVMIHWDNRRDKEQIRDTLTCFDSLRDKKIVLGLSGIRYPKVYSDVMQATNLFEPIIEVKHNFSQSVIDDYNLLLHFKPQFWAYGIGLSGLKLSKNDYDNKSYVSLVRGNDYHEKMLNKATLDKINIAMSSDKGTRHLYHVALDYVLRDKRLAGFFIAPSKVSQLNDSLEFINLYNKAFKNDS